MSDGLKLGWGGPRRGCIGTFKECSTTLVQGSAFSLFFSSFFAWFRVQGLGLMFFVR